MNKLLSNIIEYFGIEFFKAMNRKKAMDEIFRNVSEIDEKRIKEIYSNVEIFNKSVSYAVPKVINTRHKKNLQIQTMTMPSSYEPIKEFQSLYESFRENNQVVYEHVSNSNCELPAKISFIYLHGFSERSYENEMKYLFPKILNKIPNLEIIAVHLPYHMLRSPQNQPYSGCYLFDSFPLVTIEGIRQAVHDVSQVFSYLKANDKKVMVGGFSLGGFITSFLGMCDERADLYVVGQAGASLPRTLMELTVCPGLAEKREKWLQRGLDFELMYSPLSLTHYQLAVSPQQLVSIGGVYDQLVKFNTVKELRERFSFPYEIDYEAGHIGLILEMNTVREQVIKIMMKAIESGEENV